MLKYFSVIAFLVAACTLTAWAKDSPRYVRVAYQRDTTTSVAVTWNTDSPGTPTMVEYGPTTAYGHFVTGSVFMANGALKATHEAILEGLSPDTLYHYRVGAPNDWSRDHTFRTTPVDVCKPLRFVVLGDDRSDDTYGPSNKWHPILQDAVTNEHPYFVLNTGDIVEKGSDVGQWIHFLEASSSVIANTPLMTCPGNHDNGPSEGDPANYNQVFTLPRNDVTHTEDFYYFTTANAIFVSLSTESYKGGNPKFSMQADWLDQVLSDHPRMWKFVFFHRPCYTSNAKILGKDIGHPPNEEGQNKAFTAVFDKHHVDMVFSGHNHWYERIGPLKGNGDSKEGIPVGDPSKGTIYIVTGGAGAMTYQKVLSLFCPGTKGSKVCSDKFHYVSLEIDYNVLHVKVWSTKQQLVSSSDSNRKLIDQFDIVKHVPDSENPCRTTAAETEVIPDQGQAEEDENTSESIVEQGSEPAPELASDNASELNYLDSGMDSVNDIFDTQEYVDLLNDVYVDQSIPDTPKHKEVRHNDVVTQKDTTTNHRSPSGGCDAGNKPMSWTLLLLLLLLAGLYTGKIRQ